MPRGRQLAPMVVTDEQREQLTALSQSTSMPHGLVTTGPGLFSPARRA